jgi:hypothetical protein
MKHGTRAKKISTLLRYFYANNDNGRLAEIDGRGETR